MPRLTISERIRITQLAADRLRRGAVSSILHAPPFRWHFSGSAGEQLLIVPQDLRTADPSFWNEVEVGQFGLAGMVGGLGMLIGAPVLTTPSFLCVMMPWKKRREYS